MKHKLQHLTKRSLTAASVLSVSLVSALSAQISVIPLPNQIEEIADSEFEITQETAIRYDNRLKNEAELLATEIEKATGHKPKLYEEKLRILLDSQIYLDLAEKTDKNSSKESYTLTADKNGIDIKGAGVAGAFYGSQSLLQLIPLDDKKLVPGVKITDTPRFGWRGMHLDVGRHMFAPEDIKKFIDQLAVHKLNTLHWHLTEDQGWRIEIKKYPKLTEIGGYRDSTPPYGNRKGSDGKRYGGFYTQEEIKDLVAYAQKRHITIVPEIDMPGHMTAAIAAYPHLGNTDIPNYNPKVATKWGVFYDILSPKEETFQWVDDVLTEVCELFPSTYIHIGGDEAPKKQWKESKIAQDVMKREGLKNEHDLQSYFIGRVEKMLDAKGRKLIGWDEIREGGLSPKATMMLWRGWEHAIASVNEGHDVVMAPVSHTYFDYYQNDRALELAKGPEYECIGGNRSLSNVYSFDPMPKEFKGTAKAKHILGCQAQLWSEYLHTWEKVEYQAFPRLAALAECAWTQPEKKNYEVFFKRLQPMLTRYKKAGINYFDPNTKSKLSTKDGAKVTSSLKPHAHHVADSIYDGHENSYFWSNTAPKENDHLTLELNKASKGGKIKVTTGGMVKGAMSDRLEHGILVASANGKDWKKLAEFKDGVALGEIPLETKFFRILVTKDQASWLIVQDFQIK